MDSVTRFLHSLTRSDGTNNMVEQSDAPNPYKLALGLLKHPNRQLSGAGDRGR